MATGSRRPGAPRMSIEATSIVDATNIRVRLRTAKNGVPEAQRIIIHRDYREVGRVITDTSGFYDFVTTYTQTSKKQTIVFEFFLEGGTEKATVTVEIPEAAAAPKVDDPQKVVLIRTHDGYGAFTVLIRVIKAQGYGLETDVDVLFDGDRYSVRTDARGLYQFNVPRVIDPGENIPFRVMVSGIEDPATIKITRPRIRTTVPRGMTVEWILGTNNGRAVILLCLAAFFWVFATLIGIGKPMIHENYFRNNKGLSRQEITYNQVINQAYSKSDAKELVIAPTKVPGKWHHLVWKIAIILTLVFLIYGPLSLREEIADEIGRVVENLRDRDYAQAGDPWFEKLVAWSGTYAVAHNKSATVSASATSSNPSAPTAHEEKKGGWSSFPMHLASDAIVEILPAIFRAMFGR